MSLTPPMSGGSNQPLGHGWLSQEDLRPRGPAPDHAPISPQSSVASSGSGGSEHLEEHAAVRSTFHEEGSGMRGEPQMCSCAFKKKLVTKAGMCLFPGNLEINNWSNES